MLQDRLRRLLQLLGNGDRRLDHQAEVVDVVDLAEVEVGHGGMDVPGNAEIDHN